MKILSLKRQKLQNYFIGHTIFARKIHVTPIQLFLISTSTILNGICSEVYFYKQQLIHLNRLIYDNSINSINYGMKYGHIKNLHEKQLKMMHKKLMFLLWTCLWSYPHLCFVSRSSVCRGNTCGRTATVRPWSTRRSTSSCCWGDSRAVSRPRWPSSPERGPTPSRSICTRRPDTDDPSPCSGLPPGWWWQCQGQILPSISPLAIQNLNLSSRVFLL